MSDDRYILEAREELEFPEDRELSTPELRLLLARAQQLKEQSSRYSEGRWLGLAILDAIGLVVVGVLLFMVRG